jgi:DNA replication protein DnaC
MAMNKITNKTKGTPMMMNTTIEQLRDLRLAGMATGLQEQLSQAGMTAISFEERLALLVDREVHWRNDKRQTRLIKDAKLKYSQASIEDLDTRTGRGLDRKALMSLALGDWIESGHSVLITGPTGAGKSWLACALAQYACRRGHSVLYQRVPRLNEDLRIRHGNGTFGKWLIQLAKTDVELTRFDGHLIVMKEGVPDAKNTQPQAAISGAISPANDRFSRHRAKTQRTRA